MLFVAAGAFFGCFVAAGVFLVCIVAACVLFILFVAAGAFFVCFVAASVFLAWLVAACVFFNFIYYRRCFIYLFRCDITRITPLPILPVTDNSRVRVLLDAPSTFSLWGLSHHCWLRMLVGFGPHQFRFDSVRFWSGCCLAAGVFV